MLKRLFGDILTDLGDLEGDYRVAQLRTDISHSLLYMFVFSAGILVMLWVDAMLFRDRPSLFLWMIALRGAYVIVTALFGFILNKTTGVRVFDHLMFGWMLFTIIFLTLLNFTRPADYIATPLDVLIIFVI